MNFPITISDVTVPIDVVVIDAESYSAIVGNDWLSKVQAQLDYRASTLLFTWQGRKIEVAVEYQMMPHERARREKEGVEGEESEEGSEEEDEEEGEDEEKIEEEYEEEELEERVYCCYQFERESLESVKQSIVKKSASTSNKLVLVNQGIYLQKIFYHRDYF